MSSSGLVLLSQEGALRSSIASLLSSNGTTYQLESTCQTLTELSAHLTGGSTSVALVDLATPAVSLAELAPVIERFPRTRFVLIAEQQDSDLLMEAMQVGARFVMARPELDTQLDQVLHRIRHVERLPEVKLGRVITVLSTGGGCGATTIAVNLADELRQLHEEPVLLTDLDLHYGAAGAYLGIEGQYGIADVLGHQSQIDDQLLRSTAQNYDRNLDVLLSPVSTHPLDPPPANLENLPMAIDACRRAYGYTVVDAPRLPMAATEKLIAASHAILLVLQLSVKDVRMGGAMLASIRSRGVPMDRIMPVVNRFRGRHQWISFAEAQEVLNGVALEWVRNDYRNASRGINFGKLLGIAAPRSVMRKDLRRLALKLAPPRSTT